MDRAEVFELLIVIKENYPNFDVSDASVERHLKYLKDFPFETAVSNVEQHVLTSRFAPNIAEIRGSVGDQREHEQLKAATQQHFDKLESWEQTAAPPPPGLREALHARLRRTE
ncbi:replicative helicase loader/inhibitor [Paenibacillus sp. JX-17]|uniref:Replicative helicase loader/inhibitor n=1 Tax=Paenibacillus lacisoli TaxID=3064525 RepID=A0ABT9CLH7_9BACL|nr:replicative helicase loader/inhibitor [Paenibacillus sp. JX-17]MDO7908458.1 replicative helicase loader/inhibitor [Paenibacillus sp. JX-17]